MTTHKVVDPLKLVNLAKAMLQATGSNAEEADIVARHLVEANLCGHDSHGVGLLPMYVRDRLAGKMCANGHAKLLREDGVTAVFDAGMAYGHVAMRELTQWAIPKAKQNGVVIATMRNAFHVARLGEYVEMASAEGLISILFVNVLFGAPRVAAFGGADGKLHTNPICIGIPGDANTPSFLLDFATSRIAIGKVRVAFEEGRTLQPGVLIDAEGQPTQNPGTLFSEPFGAILPFGEHKGYGLAVACEILAGALSGGVTNQKSAPTDRALTNSALAIFIDPARFTELPVFHREIAEITAHLKASRPAPGSSGVLIAGEPERMSKAERQTKGIPIGTGTWKEIIAAAKSAGCDPRPFE